MAVDMSEVLGQDLMDPEKKDQVIQILRALPVAAAEVKQALGDWARQTGAQVTARDFGIAAGTRKKRRGR